MTSSSACVNSSSRCSPTSASSSSTWSSPARSSGSPSIGRLRHGVDLDAIALATRVISRGSTSTIRSRAATRSRSRAPGSSGRCARPTTSSGAVGHGRERQDQSRASRATAGSAARSSTPTTTDRRHGRRRHRRRSATTTSSRPAPCSSGAASRSPAGAKPASRRRRRGVMSNLDMMEALQIAGRREGHLGRHAASARSPTRWSRRTSACPAPHEDAWVKIDPDTVRHPRDRPRLDEDGNRSATSSTSRPTDFGRIAAQTSAAGDEPAHPRGRARAEVRGVRRPRGRHRHRHHPAERQPLHAARPRQGRGAAAAGRAGALRAARARRPR